jgi:uncharacterized protein
MVNFTAMSISISAYAIRSIQTFAATASGLAFETIPFLLIGTALSSAIHVFVPDKAIRRVIPKNRFAAILAAAAIGAVLPVCECAIVPLARRLREKGVPESAALAFMLAAPIVNPITLISTAVAFRGTGHALWAIRFGAGLAVALAVAFLAEIKRPSAPETGRRFAPIARSGYPRAPLAAGKSRAARPQAAEAISRFLSHAGSEFLDTSRYLVGGICVAALVRALIPIAAISKALADPISAIPTGMAAAFILSLCSSADAFVARTLFVPQSYGAAVAFMVFGPMMDVKTAALLSRFLKKGELRRLIIALALACLAATILLAPFWGAWR